MASACELIDAELALDRLEAVLARELPGHLRAFARAHAAGQVVPPAPSAALDASALETARRACVHPELADRGLALLRLLAPIAIESDPAVTRARNVTPSWDGYASLMAARDGASSALFGRRVVELLHQLHGGGDVAPLRVPSRVAPAAAPPAQSILVDGRPMDRGAMDGRPMDRGAMDGRPMDGGTMDGGAMDGGAMDGGLMDGGSMDGGPSTVAAMLGTWHLPSHVIDDPAIERAWTTLAAITRVRGTLRVERSSARPRAFVVEPGREVVVVVPDVIATAAKRFAVLHELGHAVCGLASKMMVPRVLDEAVASLVARLMESTVLEVSWRSPMAAPVRERRIELAMALDGIESAVASDAAPVARLSIEVPPWSLWHDPAAQASYVAAETLADRLHLESIASDIARERLRIDAATRL